jgi:hypothetical protein
LVFRRGEEGCGVEQFKNYSIKWEIVLFDSGLTTEEFLHLLNNRGY